MTKDSSLNQSIPVPSISGIIYRSPEDLKPRPSNPRVHPEKQMTPLKASIQSMGFTTTVLVDEAGVILSGHGRTQAAKELGLSTIPVRVISGLTEAQKAAYTIADNKLALLSSWDNDILKAEMEILITNDISIETTGFTTAEVDLMFDDPTDSPAADPGDLQAEDIVPEIVTREGDGWVLSNHRLLCANALDDDCYHLLMGDQKAQMAITDPPYNVAINGHVSGAGLHAEFKMASGEMTPAEFTAFLKKVAGQLYTFSEDGAISYVFMDWRHAGELLDAVSPQFGAPRQLCVWDKGTGGMGTFYRSQHELVYVFKKGNTSHINNFELGQHGRYRTNVWHYPGANSGQGRELLKLHPTVKPVSLIADAIRDCSHRKGLILDPFAGSGTILIAAERTGRYARAMELDPHYVDVAVLRWQRVTGQQAILAATGQTWNEVRAERLAATAGETS